MSEPLQMKADQLRQKLAYAFDHIIRGGTVEVYRRDQLMAVMLPPPREGYRYEVVPVKES